MTQPENSALVIPSRRRIRLSRLVVGLFFAGVLVSTSTWHESYPLARFALVVLGWVLIAIGVLGRVWSGSYISGRKSVTLQVHGPYSLCRNPLYFFSFLAGLGVTLQTGTLTFPVVFAATFLGYYARVIRGEEAKLASLHGSEFDAFCARVPRFWPSLKSFTEPAEYCIAAKSFRGELCDVGFFIAAGGLISGIDWLHTTQSMFTIFRLP